MKKVSLAGLALCLLMIFGLAQPIKAQQELVLTEPPSEGGGGGAPPPANTTFGGQWTLAGMNSQASTHPQANLQPDQVLRAGVMVPTVAKWLWSLKVYNRRLYAGYGDYDKNGTSSLGLTGRFAITPFDPLTGRFADTPAIELRTEAVPIYRNLFGRLFAPIMDASDNVIVRNYATDSIGTSWSEVDRVEADHIFDIAYTERFHTVCECTPKYGCTITGYAGDIWIVGARLNSAVVWRSVDDGRTFSESLAVTPEPISGLTHSRFYFAGVIQNKLYVQPYDFAANSDPNNANQRLRSYSYVLDGSEGTSWQQFPDLFPSRDNQFDSGYAPQVFNDYMVYQTRFPTEGSIRRLRALSPTMGTVTNIDFVINGTNTNITNFTIDGQYLYVLLGNGSVGRTTDITLPWSLWETYPPFTEVDTADTRLEPRNAGRSIAVLDGVLYIGTTQAQLWKLLPW